MAELKAALCPLQERGDKNIQYFIPQLESNSTTNNRRVYSRTLESLRHDATANIYIRDKHKILYLQTLKVYEDD